MTSTSAGRRPPCSRQKAIACSGSSQVLNGTGILPCLRRLKRSSSAAAIVRPSATSAAAGSWKTALTPRTCIEDRFSEKRFSTNTYVMVRARRSHHTVTPELGPLAFF
jgi:hypothetical protein